MQSAQSNLTYQLRPAQSVPSQMPQVKNLSYNPSQLRSAIQSVPNQIQTQNAYQSPGLISSEPRPALHRPQEQKQRPIQVNLNDTQYRWGPTSNVNQPQRNDQMPVGSQMSKFLLRILINHLWPESNIQEIQ